MFPRSFFKSPMTHAIQNQYLEHCQSQLAAKRHFFHQAQTEFTKSERLIDAIQKKIASAQDDMDSITYTLKTTSLNTQEQEELQKNIEEKQRYVMQNTNKLAPCLERMIELKRSIQHLDMDIEKMAEQVESIRSECLR